MQDVSVVPRKPYENLPLSSVSSFTSQTASAETGIDPSCASPTPNVNLYTPSDGTDAVVKAAAVKASIPAHAMSAAFDFIMVFPFPTS